MGWGVPHGEGSVGLLSGGVPDLCFDGGVVGEGD